MGYFSLIPGINMYGVGMLNGDICSMGAALRFLAALPMVTPHCCCFQCWPSLPSPLTCSGRVVVSLETLQTFPLFLGCLHFWPLTPLPFPGWCMRIVTRIHPSGRDGKVLVEFGCLWSSTPIDSVFPPRLHCYNQTTAGKKGNCPVGSIAMCLLKTENTHGTRQPVWISKILVGWLSWGK